MKNKIKCPICGENFNHLKELDKHIQEKHKGKVKLKKMEHPEKRE